MINKILFNVFVFFRREIEGEGKVIFKNTNINGCQPELTENLKQHPSRSVFRTAKIVFCKIQNLRKFAFHQKVQNDSFYHGQESFIANPAWTVDHYLYFLISAME